MLKIIFERVHLEACLFEALIYYSFDTIFLKWSYSVIFGSFNELIFITADKILDPRHRHLPLACDVTILFL